MAYRNRRSAHTPAAKGGSWIRPSTRWAIYHRDGFACVYCGERENLTIDHVSSAERHGAKNASENLLTACRGCNSAKQGQPLARWLRGLRNELDVLRRIRRLRAKPLDRKIGLWLSRAKRLDWTIPGLP